MENVMMAAVESLFEGKATAVARDLKLNLKKLLEGGALTEPEAALALVATASSVALPSLAKAGAERLRQLDFTAEQIQEAAESSALLGMLNVYYRFRHMIKAANGAAYQHTGLRMTALAKPALGKERFEMLSFAVSVLGGCEMCIVSHENALRESGVETEKIHDLARLAAVVQGVQRLAQLGN